MKNITHVWIPLSKPHHRGRDKSVRRHHASAFVSKRRDDAGSITAGVDSSVSLINSSRFAQNISNFDRGSLLVVQPLKLLPPRPIRGSRRGGSTEATRRKASEGRAWLLNLTTDPHPPPRPTRVSSIVALRRHRPLSGRAQLAAFWYFFAGIILFGFYITNLFVGVMFEAFLSYKNMDSAGRLVSQEERRWRDYEKRLGQVRASTTFRYCGRM